MGKQARKMYLLVLAAAPTFAACSNGSPSTLEPKGPAAGRIAGLWWFMFWTSAVVVAFIATLLIIGVIRARRASSRSSSAGGETDDLATPRRWEGRLLLFGGVIGPLVVLLVLWLFTLRDLDYQATRLRSAALTVDVIGRLWWWEVRYTQQGIVTANEIHIPVGQPVRVRLSTNGVIHSFWVPELAGKTDMISGRTTTMWMEASSPGVYRGQCAEYCGRQHAHMIFFVIADPPTRFQQWVSQEAAVPAAPSAASLRRGQQVFQTTTCGACHAIQGTSAAGTIGPDLTHFGSRRTIGAGTVPNTRGFLGGWIVNSQTIKPGNLMPPIQVGAEDLQSLIDYLESLR